MQSPILGSFLTQIEASKITEQNIKDFLGKAPSTKDIEVKERSKNLKDFNKRNFVGSDDNDDFNLPSPPSDLPLD